MKSIELMETVTETEYNLGKIKNNVIEIDKEVVEIGGKVSKIEGTLSKVEDDLGKLSLTAFNVTLSDDTDVFTATNVEEALLENKISILELQNELNELNGQRIRGIEIMNSLINKL